VPYHRGYLVASTQLDCVDWSYFEQTFAYQDTDYMEMYVGTGTPSNSHSEDHRSFVMCDQEDGDVSHYGEN
jgi:hypothetical protein